MHLLWWVHRIPSNSQRLREVALRFGCDYAVLVQRASEIDWSKFSKVKTLGLTAGASAPEIVVEEIIEAVSLPAKTSRLRLSKTADETVTFNLPRELRSFAAE